MPAGNRRRLRQDDERGLGGRRKGQAVWVAWQGGIGPGKRFTARAALSVVRHGARASDNGPSQGRLRPRSGPDSVATNCAR
jgi:hypothetical protein